MAGVTSEQRRNFVDHLCGAHSWYKHLSLRHGGEFVVFLAGDAGAGYPADAPRLHYSWKTTEEYRQRFGHLDYQWRPDAGQPYRRDGCGAVLDLPEDLPAACRFVLYPYVSTDFNASEAITYGIHQAELPAVRRDGARADRDLVDAWDTTQRALSDAWALGLDPREEAVVLDLIEQDEPELGDASAEVRAVYAAEVRGRVAYQALQRAEERKIVNALDNLSAWASRR